MLYHLFNYLHQFINIPGGRLFNYLTFRAAFGAILALVIGLFLGKYIIKKLQKLQIGEEIRNLGLEGQIQKKGTPTMGGIIILLSILIPTLLLADLTNIYTQLMIVSTIWLGILGYADDYIKVFKKDKEGLKGIFKIIGQVGLGLIVGITIYTSDHIVVREKATPAPAVEAGVKDKVHNVGGANSIHLGGKNIQCTKTTIPFFKNNEFDYKMLAPKGEHQQQWGWAIFIMACIFIITAVSNGANLTDGMDGLLSGISIVIGATLGILAYLSSNIMYADYLNIMYIPHSGELFVFISIFVGALIGFLWYNTYPAQVFMGDTGSLAIGGIIGVFCILIRKELLVPILCGIFFVESLSVIMQTLYFKYTKKKYGQGRRIFKMSPLHHHFQKEGIPALLTKPHQALPEAKIVTRFIIISIIVAIFSIVTLKLR